MSYKNIVIQTTSGEQHFPEADTFGVNITGFLTVKYQNRWYNYNLESVLFYSSDEAVEESRETHFDDTNITRFPN